MPVFALEGPIHTAAEDRLRRSLHVQTIVDLLLDPSAGGFVVSLEGAWGSGKTSVLNMVAHSLAQREGGTPVIVRFSPWLVGDAGTLVREFLKQLSLGIAMPRTGEIVERADKLFDVARKITKYLRYVPGVGPFREDLKELEEAIGVTQEVVKATDTAAAASRLDVNERKQAVTDALAALESPVIVVLDDVDRLAPKDVYEVIRLVRAVGDFPRVRYILAMDPGYVESALEKSGVAQPANFLDKIFHHRFVIPPVFPEQLQSLLLERVEALHESHPNAAGWLPYRELLGHLLDEGLAEQLSNLRDIKLIANRVQLQADLMAEVNLADLVALETLAIKAPSVHRHILRAPDAYTGATGKGRGDRCTPERHQAAAEACDRALGEVPLDLCAAVTRTLSELFPESSAQYDGTSSHARAAEVAMGRLSAPSRLRIAVTGSIPLDDVSLRHVHAFVTEPARRSEVVAEVCRLNALARFAWLLTGATAEGPEHLPAQLQFVEPEDALAHFGRLLDDPASQDRSAQGLSEGLFKLLRVEAEAGGQPLLSGRYGVTQSFMEMQLWREEPEEAREAMPGMPQRDPWERLTKSLRENVAAIERSADRIWLTSVQPRLLAGECAHLANMREICELRDRMLREQTPEHDGAYVLPEKLLNFLRRDVDRRGRAFYQSLPNERDGLRELLATVPPAETLQLNQRAALAAIDRGGEAVHEDDLTEVAPADLLPEPADEAPRDVLPAY